MVSNCNCLLIVYSNSQPATFHFVGGKCLTFNTFFSTNYFKCTLNHTTNDPVTARAALSIARKGALQGLTQTVKPQFIGSLSSLSLINGGLWDEKKAYGNI